MESIAQRKEYIQSRINQLRDEKEMLEQKMKTAHPGYMHVYRQDIRDRDNDIAELENELNLYSNSQ